MRRNSFFLPMTRLSKLTIFDRVRRKMQEKIRKRERLTLNGQGTDAWRPRQDGNGLNHHLGQFRIRCFILVFKPSYLGNKTLRLQRVWQASLFSQKFTTSPESRCCLPVYFQLQNSTSLVLEDKDNVFTAFYCFLRVFQKWHITKLITFSHFSFGSLKHGSLLSWQQEIIHLLYESFCLLNTYFLLQTSTNVPMVLLCVIQKPLTATTLIRATNASVKTEISQ